MQTVAFFSGCGHIGLSSYHSFRITLYEGQIKQTIFLKVHFDIKFQFITNEIQTHTTFQTTWRSLYGHHVAAIYINLTLSRSSVISTVITHGIHTSGYYMGTASCEEDGIDYTQQIQANIICNMY